METERGTENARIQLPFCVCLTFAIPLGLWGGASCGLTVHLRVMCAAACGQVIRYAIRGLHLEKPGCTEVDSDCI
jgi:hypothetical protein